MLQAWMVSQIPGAGSSIWSPLHTHKCSTTTRRHLFLTSIHTTPESMLHLIRQRWIIENEWHWARDAQLGEDALRYANRTGAPVFSLLKTMVMNLLRRGGYRSIRQGQRVLGDDINGMSALGGVTTSGATT